MARSRVRHEASPRPLMTREHLPLISCPAQSQMTNAAASASGLQQWPPHRNGRQCRTCEHRRGGGETLEVTADTNRVALQQSTMRQTCAMRKFITKCLAGFAVRNAIDGPCTTLVRGVILHSVGPDMPVVSGRGSESRENLSPRPCAAQQYRLMTGSQTKRCPCLTQPDAEPCGHV